jgi:hypothetical protein
MGNMPHQWLTEAEFKNKYNNYTKLICNNPSWRIMGGVLRKRRMACDLSLREFAKLAGWTPSYTSEVETGLRSSTDKEVLKKYSYILNNTSNGCRQ